MMNYALDWKKKKEKKKVADLTEQNQALKKETDESHTRLETLERKN